MGLQLVPTDTNIPFIAWRGRAAVFSAILLVASIGLFAARGLNLGIDFVGGILLEVGTGETADIGRFRGALGDLGLGDVTVQEFGEETEVLIRVERQPADEAAGVNEDQAQMLGINKVKAALHSEMGGLSYPRIDTADDIEIEVVSPGPAAVDRYTAVLERLEIEGATIEPTDSENAVLIRIPAQKANFEEALSQSEAQAAVAAAVPAALDAEMSGLDFRREEIVGPKVAGELITAGIISVMGAVGAVLLYIWFRFEWQFGVGAVVALVHDVIMTIGFFAVTRLEFNLSIVAAILTIVGYSLNDTVVVYDRIREKLRKFQKMELRELLDKALNKTLSRTLMTSLTTLIALFALFFLGGEVIRPFTAAMIWGIVVGTYSSIFIAAPILIYLDLRREGFEGAKTKPA